MWDDALGIRLCQCLPVGVCHLPLCLVLCRYELVIGPGSRSQWPRSLRLGSAATRLLGLWVGISPGAWISCLVCCEWRVVSCQVEVCASGRPVVRRVLPRVVCLSVIVKPWYWGDPGPPRVGERKLILAGKRYRVELWHCAGKVYTRCHLTYVIMRLFLWCLGFVW
jgi:hypothetical protein